MIEKLGTEISADELRDRFCRREEGTTVGTVDGYSARIRRRAQAAAATRNPRILSNSQRFGANPDKALTENQLDE